MQDLGTETTEKQSSLHEVHLPLKKLSSFALGGFIFISFIFLVIGLAVLAHLLQPSSAHVADLTETLTRQEIQWLKAKPFSDFNIAILLIPTLAGDSLEHYSIRLAKKWKIGQDDGVILLVVLDDRMVRIQVGSNLKGTLPDDRARAIISKEIAPRLRKDDFYGGIYQGLSAIIEAAGDRLRLRREG